MTLEEKFAKWDALTSRLLQWRGIVGEDGSPVGEWARKEVVQVYIIDDWSRLVDAGVL